MKCSLCNSETELKCDHLPGYQIGMEFSIHYCKVCDTSFPSPTVDASQIYEYIYKNGDHVPGYDRYWRYFKEIKTHKNPIDFLASKEEAYWGIKKVLSQNTNDKENSKILEIGSGLGYLTYALRQEDYNISGIDISSEAVNQAKKQFGDYYIHSDLFEYTKQHEAQYDVIILTEVIEHVEKPLVFLEAAKNLIKKGGLIIITTPNKTIFPKDIIWETESPPIHHWWFSEASMSMMAKKKDLDISFVDFTEFYKKKPKLFRLKKIRNKQFRSPILNEKGALINRSNFKKPSATKSFYNAVKMSVRKLKAKSDKSIVVCKERGETICAVYKK